MKVAFLAFALAAFVSAPTSAAPAGASKTAEVAFVLAAFASAPTSTPSAGASKTAEHAFELAAFASAPTSTARAGASKTAELAFALAAFASAPTSRARAGASKTAELAFAPRPALAVAASSLLAGSSSSNLLAVTPSSQLLAANTATSTASLGAQTSTSTADEDVIQLYPEEPLSEEAPLEEPSRSSFARSSIKLESRLSVDTSFDQRGEHIVELGLGGRLEIDVDVADKLSAFVAPSFYYVAAIGREGDDRQELFLVTPEARVNYSFGPFDLRAGALVFNWGSSDLIGPSDVLNPLDYRRNFVAAIDDLKIPVIAAELVTAIGPLTIRAVIEPFFTPSRYFVTSWDTALIQPTLNSGFNVQSLERLLGKATVDAIGDQLLLPERPNERPDDATLAMRATLTSGDLDLSVTAVHGWEPLPQIYVDRSLVTLTSIISDAIADKRPLPFEPSDPGFTELATATNTVQTALRDGRSLFSGTYHRRDMIGFDAAYALDPFVFKIDSAYSFERTSYTQDYRPVTNPWLNTVVGIEYVRGDELQVIVEAFNITIFDVRSDVRLAFFEPAARPPSQIINGYRTLATPGVAGVVRYAILDGDLRFELASVATLTRGDVLVLPSIHLEIDDAQELSVGGTAVEGKSDGYGGAYSHNDEVYVRYQWTH